jgi:hypothetical protein
MTFDGEINPKSWGARAGQDSTSKSQSWSVRAGQYNTLLTQETGETPKKAKIFIKKWKRQLIMENIPVL